MSDNRQVGVAELSFEQALEELEAIVAQLEGGQVPLDDTLSRFERAMALKERCASLLQSAETRISKLMDEQGNTERLMDEQGNADPFTREADDEQ